MNYSMDKIYYRIIGPIIGLSYLILFLLVFLTVRLQITHSQSIINSLIPILILIIPAIGIGSGIYYTRIGFRDLEINKSITASSITYILAIIILLLGIPITALYCSSRSFDNAWAPCAIIYIYFIAINFVATTVGHILLAIGYYTSRKE
jgi:hypothetical protein